MVKGILSAHYMKLGSEEWAAFLVYARMPPYSNIKAPGHGLTATTPKASKLWPSLIYYAGRNGTSPLTNLGHIYVMVPPDLFQGHIPKVPFIN